MGVIETLLDQNLDLGGKYYRPLEYFKTMDPNIVSDNSVSMHPVSPKASHVLEYYREALGWIRANPSIPEVGAAIRSLYIWPKSNRKDGVSYANLKRTLPSFLDCFLDFSAEAIRKDFYITGEKGVGKTYFINYLLNTFTYKIKRNGIMWYRVDASQVYQRKLPLLRYFYLQVIYVSLKYPNSSIFLENVYNKSSDFIDHLEAQVDPCFLPSAGDIFDKYLNIVKSAKDSENREKGQVDIVHKNLFHNIFLKKRNPTEEAKIETEVEFLGKAILSYLIKKGIKLLLIFDGIDNIDYIKGRTEYSQFLTELINSFGLGVNKTKMANTKIVILCRKETFEHIRFEAQTYGGPIRFKIMPIKISDIIGRKIEKIISAKAIYIQNKRRKAEIIIKKDKKLKSIDLSIEVFDNWIKQFGDRFVNTILKYLKSDEMKGLRNIDDLLLYLYSNNLRSFINNLLNAFEYKMLFEREKKLENREYTYLEGMFLDGKLLYESNNDSQNTGDIPNIFCYHTTDKGPIWHGLCGVRILNLLKKVGPHTKEEIRIILEKHFGYYPLIIEELVQRFVEQGLIAPKYRKHEPLKYYILPKGVLFLLFSFKNIDFLYSLALDTPLKYNAVSNSKMVNIHEKFWENYTECALKTVFTMIRHIKSQVKIENEAIINRIRENEIAADEYTETFLSFSPKFISILKTASLLMKKLSAERKKDLLADLEGLVGWDGQLSLF